KTMGSDTIRRLLSACSGYAPTGVRNGAVITLLYHGGLRLGEALSLPVESIDTLSGRVSVPGRHPRVISIDRDATEVLGRWLRVRGAMNLPQASPLFCTLAGAPLTPDYLRQLLPRLATKAGLDARVHAQSLRDAHAAGLRASGLPMEAIQERLGYDSLRSLA